MEPKLLTAARFVDQEMGCSYRYVYSDTEYFRPHFHDYYEIFVLLDGNAHHFVNGSDFLLKKGSIVFIRPTDVHDYLCVDGKPFSMLNFTFDQQTADALMTYLGKDFFIKRLQNGRYPPTYSFSDRDFVWFNAQMTSIRSISPTDKSTQMTAIRVLLFRLVTKCFLSLADDEQCSEEMPDWLASLCEEMRRNENFVFGSARMVELSGKSREHLARSLKQYTGMTVSEFVNDLRLSFVANMLRNSNHSISHILFESGFNNVSWASTLFRKKYGMTMHEFRAE